MLANIIILIIDEFLQNPWHGPKSFYNDLN